MWKFTILAVMTVLGEAAADPEHSFNPDTYSASRTVIVLSQKTQVYAGDKPIGVVSPGSVLRFTKVHEKWLMVPRYGGWVFADDVIPVELAVEQFSKLIAEKPSPDALLHRGIAHLQLDELDKAAADFEMAIQNGSKEASVYINLGNVYQKRGALSEALSSYSKGIEADPDNPFPYIERSSVLMEMKQFTEAAADLEKALVLEPTSPEAYNNRGVLHRLLAKYPEAIADYNKAIELFSKYADAHANRGFALRQQGQYEESKADFEKALTFDPLSAEIANDVAWLYATCPDEKIRDPERAIKLADQACSATDKKNGQYLDTLAAAFASAGKFEVAIKVGEEALKLLEGDLLATEAHARLELYRKNQPFIEKLATP